MKFPSRAAVFLDRDGVLNELVERDGGEFSPQTLEQFRLFPWTRRALMILHQHGFLLVVVTNQPDISRGKMASEALEAMHETLRQDTPVKAIYVCEHDESDNCGCRKPKTGLFKRAAEDLNINMSDSWTIGDRESDLIAGKRCGTRLIHIKGAETISSTFDECTSLSSVLEAASYIISTLQQDTEIGI